MRYLAGKHVLVGITGGIAAYKIPDLIRRLKKAGAEIRVVMTTAASQFVTPLTLQTLSGHSVYCDPFNPESDNAMDHIELARWADRLLIAPATANCMARLAHGLADDLLSTVYLATSAPTIIAPAMNTRMWTHPATRKNVNLLASRDIFFIEPESGQQACGDNGPGRMAEPEIIMQALNRSFRPAESPRILISAGPTYEDIDPVRFIGNRSSGKMGFSLATYAHKLHLPVTLVHGPTAHPPPLGISSFPVRSADEMLKVVKQQLPSHDIFISAAAVSDYRPAAPQDKKTAKNDNMMTLALEPTPDILAQTADIHGQCLRVGFAAETHDMEEHALQKMKRKHLDMIIANPVGNGDSGMESDYNQACVYWSTKKQEFPRTSKNRLAKQLIDLILEYYCEKNTAKGS